MNQRNPIYIAFNKHVVALDRLTGTVLWEWVIPKGRTYPAILVDDDLLIVSAMGYTYALNRFNGTVMWENELDGMGVGVSCIATVNGNSNTLRSASAAQAAAQAAQNS